jgi:hypothetical protein
MKIPASRSHQFALSSIVASLLACTAIAADPDVKADKAERTARNTTERTVMTRNAAENSASTKTAVNPSPTPVSKTRLRQQLKAEKAEALRRGDKTQAKKLQEQLDRLK